MRRSPPSITKIGLSYVIFREAGIQGIPTLPTSARASSVPPLRSSTAVELEASGGHTNTKTRAPSALLLPPSGGTGSALSVVM